MRQLTYFELRAYVLIAYIILSIFVLIFSSWLSALFFTGVLLVGGVIALVLRRSDKGEPPRLSS